MELYPPQAELVEELGTPLIKGRLIGDEPGIGKTIEALGIDKRLRQHFKGHRITLIIAPRSTHEKPWADTIRRYLGKPSMIIDRKNRAPFINAILSGDYEYYICHYDAMRLIIKQIQGVQFMHVIADECQEIKNPTAQRTRAVKKLKTLSKTAMSGTPADNKPEDLWSVLNWLYPGKFSSREAFIREFCEQVEGTGRTGIVYHSTDGVRKKRLPSGAIAFGPDGRPLPDPEVMAKLHAQMSMFFRRRRKKDVLKDLPDKYFSEVRIDLHPEQRRVYDELRRDMLTWIGEHKDEALSVAIVVAQLVRLQQAALAYLEWSPEGKVRLREPSAKLDELEHMLAAGEINLPLVAFSQSKSMIRLTGERLSKAGLRIAEFHGDVPDMLRQSRIDDFQAGKYDVFAATIRSGGVGITLTASSTEVFFDRDWSPAKNLQAEDRCHRDGQKNAVQVIDFFARDTVDSEVRDANIRKWSGIQALLGDK
jgi:SNF2 family DNA or RNA helicase